MKYFTADLHLDDPNAIKYNDRPFKDIDAMQAYLLSQIDALPKGSTLYLLGDTLIRSNKAAARKILDQFPKHVNYVFIPGNHDYRLRHLFKEYGHVESLMQIRHKGRKIVLCHYPMYEWSDGQNGSILLHGHTHFRSYLPGLIMDVGWDAQRCPIAADAVLMMLEKFEIYQLVHRRNNGKTYADLIS